MLATSGNISLVNIYNELYSKVPIGVVNSTGSFGSYYTTTRSFNNTEKGGTPAVKITTTNNTHNDGFITSNNGLLTNGVQYILSYEVWVPTGYNVSIGMRQQTGGGGYFHKSHVGNNAWVQETRVFTANTNTSSMVQGYQYDSTTSVISFYIRNICLIQKTTLDLNNSLVRKLAAKPSGTISFSDFRGKEGQFSYSKNYTHSYPWTPPATQAFSGTLSSATTNGNFQGTLNKSGGQTNSYGGYAWYGSEVQHQNDTTAPAAVNSQIGATWISGTYEYKWVVNRSVNVGYWSYANHYDVWKKQQRRLITVNQNYSGTVYLRG